MPAPCGDRRRPLVLRGRRTGPGHGQHRRLGGSRRDLARVFARVQPSFTLSTARRTSGSPPRSSPPASRSGIGSGGESGRRAPAAITRDAREGDPQVAWVGNEPPTACRTRSRVVHGFARTASSARSGASPCRSWIPHAWLSPAASARYSSTASLRHVRGSPALRLLRRLRPSPETWPDWTACRASLARRSREVPIFQR
jgi:hypothetical protein